MNNETLHKELAMCRQLSQENGGRCNWGECKNRIKQAVLGDGKMV